MFELKDRGMDDKAIEELGDYVWARDKLSTLVRRRKGHEIAKATYLLL